MGSESSLSLRTLGSQLTDEYGVGSVTSALGLACPAMLGGRQWPDAAAAPWVQTALAPRGRAALPFLPVEKVI